MEGTTCLSDITILLIVAVSFNFAVAKPVFVTHMVVDDVKITNETYMKNRQHLLLSESLKRLGGEIVLSPAEQKANDILMKAKRSEIESSLQGGKPFPVAANFILSKPLIDASPVFQLITKMPKGNSVSFCLLLEEVCVSTIFLFHVHL